MIGIYGASGFGREVAPIVREAYWDEDIVFIDDGSQDAELNGHPVMNYAAFRQRSDRTGIIIAIADAAIRKRLAELAASDGIDLLSIRSSTARVFDGNQIGAGAILCDNVIVTSNARIGRQFHANLYSYVAHDCVIGDFVTFAPKVCCNGNVHIGDNAYIGTGAILRQGQPGAPLTIGDGAIIGMGAVVTKNVAPGETVVGNPAKPLTR